MRALTFFLLGITGAFAAASQAATAGDGTIQLILKANHGVTSGRDMPDSGYPCVLEIYAPGEWVKNDPDARVMLKSRQGNTDVAYPGVGGWVLDQAHAKLTFYFDSAMTNSLGFSYDPASFKITASTFSYRNENGACEF